MPRGGARPGSGPKVGPDGKALNPYKYRREGFISKPENVQSENVKTVQADQKPQPQQRTFDLASTLALIERSHEAARNKPRTEAWNPFIIRPGLFGPINEYVKQKAPHLAMDQKGAADRNIARLAQDNQIAVQAWQAGSLLGNVVSEGLLFLGYPYLAELAQRPEYRLFGEIRAEEMTRKWIDIRGTKDESTKSKKDDDRPDTDDDKANKRAGNKPRGDDRNKEIEAKIKELVEFGEDLGLRDWFKATASQDAFFGISHLLLDLKGVDLDNLQDPELKESIGNGRNAITREKLGKGCLLGMRTIEAIWCYPTTYNAVNPLQPSWYDPQVWYVMGTEIHKTRLLTFIGRPVPDILKPAYAFGGLSVTQMAQPYVNIWLKTRQSVGEIIHAFSVMVLATKLATTTMPGGSGGGAGDVISRLLEFITLRDNQGVFAIDKETEEFSNVSAPISGLAELQAQAQEHMFSVCRIPSVKFAGISPHGLNASSEGELKAFYDTILGEQNHLFRPNLTTILDIMQISLWGTRDPDITFDFVPLWESTEKEKSEIRKLDAETAQIRIDSGVISQEEERTRLASDPESGYHGIDPDDVPDLLLEEEQGLEPAEGRPQPQAGKANGKGNGKEAESAKDVGIQNFDEENPNKVPEVQVNRAPKPGTESPEEIRAETMGSRDDLVTPAEARRQARITGGDGT